MLATSGSRGVAVTHQVLGGALAAQSRETERRGAGPRACGAGRCPLAVGVGRGLASLLQLGPEASAPLVPVLRPGFHWLGLSLSDSSKHW